MKLFLRGLKVADPNSEFNEQTVNIRIVDGKYEALGPAIEPSKSDQIIDLSECVAAPGFFDMNCFIGDPGLETKEEIETAAQAAVAGGYTGILNLSQKKSSIETKSKVDYILQKASRTMVDIIPAGAISKHHEGKDLTEMYDMQKAGALAFSDADQAIQDDGFMSRALQYAKGIQAKLLVYPENASIAGKSQIHESAHSILMGMKGIPAIAEELQIARDLCLAQYHDAPIHIQTISSAGSVALIKKAKKDGIKVTCEVAAHQLNYTEEINAGFDSHYKVKPPFREKADQKALIQGLKDGVIDIIVSQHRPHEIEFKKLEFEQAAYGIIGLQTTLHYALKAGLTSSLITEKLALNPRIILGLAIPKIQVEEFANIVCYHPTQTWEYSTARNYSKSANSPLLGQTLTGLVKTVVHNTKIYSYEQ
ncbi:MAG: dihydroorotase [Pedobacter sp.]|nr:MAG: dihydroorotase [Pedobacter sp.]